MSEQIYDLQEPIVGLPRQIDEGVKPLYIDTINYDVHYEMPEGEEFKDWFKVDPLIATSISILNKKGYKTASNSCQGHVPIMDGTTILEDMTPLLGHIAFEEHIVLPSFPEGYYPVTMRFGNGFNNCLVSDIQARRSYIGKDERIYELDEDDLQMLIEIQCSNLEQWSISLPEYKYSRAK